MNKKRIAAALALGAALSAGQAPAQTKAAVQFENVVCMQNPAVSPNAGGRVSVMTTSLAASSGSAFVADASLAAGLWTAAPPGMPVTGAVEIGVVLDGTFDQNGIWNGYGTVAYPGFVAFDARVQAPGQAFAGCTADSGIVRCTNLSDPATDAVLAAASAHSFRFILPNVAATSADRPHRVDVVARVSAATNAVLGPALAAACYGIGSLSIEPARLGRSFACSAAGCTAQ